MVQPMTKTALPAIAHLARAARAGDTISMNRIRDAVAEALEKHEGNRDRTARELGVSPRILDYWLLPVAQDARALGLNLLARKYPAPHRGRPASPPEPEAPAKKPNRRAKKRAVAAKS
jgi:hypothetical protein